MSNSQTNAGNAGADDAKAAKRAEIALKVAAAREQQAKEKVEQENAAREQQAKEKVEQEKSRKIREMLLQAQSEKDEKLAHDFVKKEAAYLQARQQHQAAEIQARQQEQASLAQLRANPLEMILEAKEVATELFKESKNPEAAAAYEKSEQYCFLALKFAPLETAQEEDVRRQLSLCRLNRALCLQRLIRFEESYECCMHVVKDHVSTPDIKCKAAIRAGQCLAKLAVTKGYEDKRQSLLALALKTADDAELLCGDSTDFVKAIKQLRKEIHDRQPLQVDYSKGLRTLPDMPAVQQHKPVANIDNSDSSSDSDQTYPATRAAFAQRRGAVSTYPSTGSNTHDIYGKSAYGYSRQRLARFPGIRNEGATCWGNCILQVIYHLQSFRARLRQVASQIIQVPGFRNTDQLGVAVCLLQIFGLMDHETAEPGQEAHDSVSALQLWRVCETNVLRQNDMHEFFVALIEYFEILFKRPSESNPESDAAAFFHRLFNLVSQNRISVEEFGYDQPAGDGSNVSECVLMVMDPWNQRSLRNFLRFKFVEGETVDTYINSQLHEGCADKKCPGHKARLFSGLVQCPDVLCCFLNRIEHNYDEGSQSKNSEPFEYPESFSLRDYVDEGMGPDGVYDLYAVVVHTGAVLAGHYFSFMRPEVSTSTGTLEGTPWYRFDDERVYEVEASQALVENFGTGSAGHRRSMWNWQTIKYGRTACMLFYVRRSAAAGILASGAAAAAVQTATSAGGGAAVPSASTKNAANLNAPYVGVNYSSSAQTLPPKDIWGNDEVPSPASAFDQRHAQSVPRDYTDLQKALTMLNRQDVLPAFRELKLDDACVDLMQHEQHLDELGLSPGENARLMSIWQKIRGPGDSAASAARSSPIDIKLRSLTISSTAQASLPARSVVSPDATLLPVYSTPSLSIQSIVDGVSALCAKQANEKRASDSDDEDFDCLTSNSVLHLPTYLRAYHPQIPTQMRAFHYRLQHLTGPIEPGVTLGDIAADASLVLAWTINTPTHVACSVCAGTWGSGDPTPTYVGNPVVVYVLLESDQMRTVKERAVQCFFQRNVGDGEDLARRRLNQLKDQLCLLTDSGDTLRIQDSELVSDYYEQDALRHGEDDGSHGYVMNLMLLR